LCVGAICSGSFARLPRRRSLTSRARCRCSVSFPPAILSRLLADAPSVSSRHAGCLQAPARDGHHSVTDVCMERVSSWGASAPFSLRRVGEPRCLPTTRAAMAQVRRRRRRAAPGSCPHVSPAPSLCHRSQFRERERRIPAHFLRSVTGCSMRTSSQASCGHQDKGLRFYTDVLGFKKKHDFRSASTDGSRSPRRKTCRPGARPWSRMPIRPARPFRRRCSRGPPAPP